MPLTKLLSADRIGGLTWVAFGLAVVYGAWAMDRLESLGIPLATAPGVVPGLLGIAFIIFGSILLVRHEPPVISPSRQFPLPPPRPTPSRRPHTGMSSTGEEWR